MRAVTRGCPILLLAAVVVLMGGLAPAHTAPHDHTQPGFYDPGCPLAMLAAVERQGAVVGAPAGLWISAVASLPSAVASAPLSTAAVVDLRFRAPPLR